MDEIAKVELRVDRELASKQSGPFAEITTRHGDVYRVWIAYDGLPSIELVSRGVAQKTAQLNPAPGAQAEAMAAPMKRYDVIPGQGG